MKSNLKYCTTKKEISQDPDAYFVVQNNAVENAADKFYRKLKAERGVLPDCDLTRYL
jgi:hypothetical protein